MSNNTEIEATFILEPSSLEADFLIGFSPNKTSELENDSNFIVEEQLNIATDNLVTSISQVNQDLQNTKENISNKIDANTDLINSANTNLTELINKETQERKDADEQNSQETIRLYNTLNVVKANKDTVYTKEEIDNKIASVYTIKGSVESFAKLPQLAKNGDVYNVLDTGANYVWVEDSWDKLSETINLEPYLLKKDAFQSFLEIESKLELKVDKKTGYSLLADAEIQRLSTLTNYDDTEIKENIQQLEQTKQDVLVAGNNIKITDNVISFSGVTGSEWGKITGDISNQTDLKTALNEKATKKDLENIQSLPIGTIIPISASSVYTPTGTLSCDGAEYQKADFENLWDNYLIGQDIFDPDSVTVVGSPNITDDGIASGFSTGDYVTIPNLNLQNANTWEIEGVVQIHSREVHSDKVWLSVTSGNGIILPVATQGGSTEVAFQLYLSSNPSSWDISSTQGVTFASGSRVKCNLKFTGTQYIYTCTNLDTNEVKKIEVNSSLKIYQSPTRLGLKRENVSLQQDDIIDLKQFKITVDGQVVYDCVKQVPLLNTCTYSEYEQDLATYGQCGKFAVKPLGYDGSGLTIVGSPTITEDGIASGFSSSDYIYSDILVVSNPIKIRFAFIFKNNESQQVWLKLVGTTADNNLTDFEYGKFSSAGNMYIRATINGVKNTYIYATNSFSKNWTDGDLIECEFNLSLSGCIGSISNTTKSTSAKINYTYSVDELSFNRVNIGGNGAVSLIDLKQVSITGDGQTVFDCVEGDTFKVPTITNENTDLKNFVAVANGTVDDCLATWNTLVELENYLKGV